MGTTSTFVEVKQRLLTLLAAEFAGSDVSVSYSWTPDVNAQMVFLSRPWIFEGDRDRTTVDFRPGAMRAGRMPRDEVYEIPITVASFRPDLTAQSAATADEETAALADRVEAVIVNDTNLGMGAAIRTAIPSSREREQWQFQNGWAVTLICNIEVTARIN